MFKTILILGLLILSFAYAIHAQPGLKSAQLQKDPWNSSQLIEPSALMRMIRNAKGTAKPLIYNIGVVENIKGARHFGAASEKANLDRFKKEIAKLPKASLLVVYCGCCPFNRCPNIRPAFKAMQAAGLKNSRLLNLPTNLKVDWIDKGYPLE